MHNGVFDPEAWRQPDIPLFSRWGSLVFGKSRLALIILQHGMSFTAILLAYFCCARGAIARRSQNLLILWFDLSVHRRGHGEVSDRIALLVPHQCFAVCNLRSPPWSPYVGRVPILITLLGIVRLVGQSLKRLRIQCS